MPGQGRLGDKANVPLDAHGCPACPHPAIGPAIQGSPDVNVNRRPALRVDDPGIHMACCGTNTWTATQGSMTVFINGKGAHRMGDQNRHCGGMGQLVEGSPNVIVGESGGGGGGGSGGGGAGSGGGGAGGSGGGAGGGAGGSGGGGRSGSGGGGNGGSSAGDQPSKQPAAPNVPASTQIDPRTIEVQIVNSRNVPQAGISFELRLPDGIVRAGATDASGLIRFTDLATPGTGHLVLPAHDDEHGSTAGAQTPGARLYAAGGVDVQVGQRSVVELQPRVYRGRLIGAHFDTDKTFVLPSAMASIRLLVRFYADHPGAEVMVSGHADTVGDPAYNLGLSEERAQMMAAFLTDQASVWLRNYHATGGHSQLWGSTEDRHMLSTLTDPADGNQPFYRASDGNSNAAAIRRYQHARQLTPENGFATDDVRSHLIADYMALDGTSLPASTSIASHGCGENHPVEDRGNNVNDLENRRVEIFLFDGLTDPPRPDSCPVPHGCDAYPEWVRRSVQTVDFRNQPGVFRAFVCTPGDGRDIGIANARIHLSGPTSADGTADANGRLAIDNLAPGRYSALVQADGFFDAIVDVDVSASSPEQRIVLERALQLQIAEITFRGNVRVNNDTQRPDPAVTGGDAELFPQPEWVAGRAQFPQSSVAQSPLCYVRGTAITMAARLNVTRAPARATTVRVRAQATLSTATLTWTGSATVNPGDRTVQVEMSGAAALPNQVDCVDPWTLTWQQIPEGRDPIDAGTSTHLLYVVLGTPAVTPAYFTLLDISCRGARNQIDERGFAAAVFAPFTTRQITRKRDNQLLIYWRRDPNNPALFLEPRGRNTPSLLANIHRSGECGSWASLLVDCYRVHGITSAEKMRLRHHPGADAVPSPPSSVGFLVKDWTFDVPPANNPTGWSHQFNEARPDWPHQHPGQSNPAPPPGFLNHFIVRHAGVLYDPSYGSGPFSSQLAWEQASADGLSRLSSTERLVFGFHNATQIILPDFTPVPP